MCEVLKGILTSDLRETSSLDLDLEPGLERDLVSKHGIREVLLLFGRLQLRQELLVCLELRFIADRWANIDLELHLRFADRAREDLSVGRGVPLPSARVEDVQLRRPGLRLCAADKEHKREEECLEHGCLGVVSEV